MKTRNTLFVTTHLFVLSDNVLVQGFINLAVVSPLLKGNTVDLPGLDIRRHIVGVHLQNTVLSSLFLLQNFQSFRLVIRCNHTVRYFSRDDSGRDGVNLVGQGDKVTERRHSVGTSRSGIGTGQGGELGEVVNSKDLLFTVVQWDSNSGTGRRDVLERCGGGKSRFKRSSELLDESPRVESVEKVNVSGGAREDSNGHFTLLDKSLSGLLVRVGTIPQGQPLVPNTSCGLGVLCRIDAGVHLPKVIGNGLIVSLGAFKGLESQTSLGLVRNLSAGLPFLENVVIVGGRGDDGDTSMVLGCSPEERYTTNVNLLDGTCQGTIGLGGLHHKGIEVADDQGDGGDLVGSEIGQVGLNVSGQDT